MFLEALAAIRRFQAKRKPGERLHWNRVLLDVWPPLPLSRDEIIGGRPRWLPATEGLGIESVWLRAELPDPRTGEILGSLLEISTLGRVGARGERRLLRQPAHSPALRVRPEGHAAAAARVSLYPYEIVRLMTPAAGAHSDFPPGTLRGDGPRPRGPRW